jgi:anti-sigma factor ChrR (cupin superfamily)
MAKKEQEIHETDSIPWKPVPGCPGVFEKVLNEDPETGSVTRLLKYEPGTRTNEILVHDFFEEIYVVEGSFVDTRTNLTFKKGYYGYRHPGMVHGPYYSEEGFITFEVRNYEKK